MTITAKFSSVCPICSCRIMVGEQVNWTKGTKATHLKCGQAKPASVGRVSTGGGRCRECKGPMRDARHHRAMGGLCGNCAFDEYDC